MLLATEINVSSYVYSQQLPGWQLAAGVAVLIAVAILFMLYRKRR